MRVISLIQPWASLWVAGAKRIETRSWGTEYRGRVAVAASRAFNPTLCSTEPFASALMELGFENAAQLPLGALLGWVDLTCVAEMTAGPCLCMTGFRPLFCIDHDPRLTPRERAFGLYAPGRRAWLTGRERFVAERPIPFRGSQGLRELPEAVAALL